MRIPSSSPQGTSSLPTPATPPRTPRPPHPAHVASSRGVQLDLVFASFPETEGGRHTDLLYVSLVITLPILVFVGLKIRLPWR